jgi:hypothetical protein
VDILHRSENIISIYGVLSGNSACGRRIEPLQQASFMFRRIIIFPDRSQAVFHSVEIVHAPVGLNPKAVKLSVLSNYYFLP